MLGEAFLCRLVYEDAKEKEENVGRNAKGNARQLENERADLLETQTVHRPRGETLAQRQDEYFTGSYAQISEALSIPKRQANGDCQLDLYTSWSSMYASIYKNYPDLHIAGQHILDKRDSGCVLDIENELQDGPVLVSVDLATNSPPVEILDKPAFINILGNLESRERSITVPGAPFSNSHLNSYMEQQMRELYKEFIEENPAATGSPNPMLFSSTLMNNVGRASIHLSQEQRMRPGRSRMAVANYLRSAASEISSEFATPVLHISSVGPKKNPHALSNNSAPNKGSILLK
ncbi:TLR adapter interacting with SLC15A4 on the lysosome-like [Pelodytes ibericus]